MGKHVQVPREAWLRSQRSDVYAAAIGECRSGDPSWCSANEKCRFGDCFVDSHVAEGRRELRHLVGELTKLGRDLRRRLDVVATTRPLALVNRTCRTCGGPADG